VSVQWLHDLFPMKPVRCPGCRLRIDGEHAWDRLSCPACGTVFNIRWFYVGSLYVLALTVSGATVYALGVRGHLLASVALWVALPTARAMLAISRRMFPPDLEIVAAGWTPGDSEDDQEVEQEFERLRELNAIVGPAPWDAPPPALGEWKDDTPGRSPFAPLKGPPVTVEGVLLVIALAALLAYHLYVAIGPHVPFGRASASGS
jgi:hypothetical protein